jgi:hypothetical protein
MASVMEYLPPHLAAKGLGQYYPSYWAFLAIALITMAVRIRKIPLHHLLVLLLFVVLSLRSLRFMPFLLMLAPLVAPHSIGRSGNWENSKALFAGFTAVLALWLAVTPIRVQPGLGKDFPLGSAKFIERMLPAGKIFNYHGWAGFIVWELEGRDVFMPLQGVTDEIDEAYENIIWADSTPMFGKPQWSALLDAYGIDIIVIPGVSPVSGESYPIIDALMNERQWFLVYSDEVSNIFARNISGNSMAISIYSLPKPNAYIQVIEQAKRYLKEEPKRKALWRSLGDTYRKLGRLEEAREAYEKGGVDSE